LISDPDAVIVPKDIANVKLAQRRDELSVRTSMEVLLKKLDKHRFFHEYAVESASRLQYMFWAYPESTRCFVLHHDVLILDCTYKTNQHELLLLIMIVMTSFNTVLPIAQCWLPGEKRTILCGL
jgi:hypothetical protein